MIIKITYNEPPLLVEAEIDGDHDDIADSADFFMARIAAMKKVLIKEAISADKSEKSSEEDVFVVTDSEDIWFQSGKGRFQITELRNCQSLSPNKKYCLVPVED